MKNFSDKQNLNRGKEILHEMPDYNLVRLGDATWTDWKVNIHAVIPVFLEQECILLQEREVTIWKTKNPYDKSLLPIMGTYNPEKTNAIKTNEKLLNKTGIILNQNSKTPQMLELMVFPFSNLKITYCVMYLKEDDYDEHKIYTNSSKVKNMKIPYTVVSEIRTDDVITKLILTELAKNLKNNKLII
jgi:hypothetical protein